MQYIELFKIAAENKSFLKVLFTRRHMQIAVSNLKPGEDTGEEAWNTDMSLLVLLGQGHIVLGGEDHDLKIGDLFCVPANTTYTVINLGTEPLKLLLTFSAPVFRDGTDQGTKISEIMDPYKVRPSDSIL
jgi:mannose-6-phosphate isomerase-like protein (cupin superfamily)